MTPIIPISLLVSFAFFCPLQEADFTGNWYFDRFAGPHGEVVNTPEVSKANQQEEGFKFTFTKDGKFRSLEPNGMHNSKQYEYIPEQRVIILDNDTMKIMLLTSEAMELYPTNGKQPALFLRRNKDVKLAMN